MLISIESISMVPESKGRILNSAKDSVLFPAPVLPTIPTFSWGKTVKEIVDLFKKVNDVEFDVINGPRRAGDAVCLISKAEKIKNVLGFSPKFDDLAYIVKTAIDWEKKLK